MWINVYKAYRQAKRRAFSLCLLMFVIGFSPDVGRKHIRYTIIPEGGNVELNVAGDLFVGYVYRVPVHVCTFHWQLTVFIDTRHGTQ